MRGTAEEQELKQLLWEAGDLTYMLFDHQLDFLEKYRNAPGRKFFINCSRRIGKTYFLLVLSLMHALTRPHAQIMYCAPTAKQVRGIIQPLLRQILEDCPDHLVPEYKGVDSQYLFHNGSVLNMAGCDNGNHENLRGMYTTLGIVDEAGKVDELKYVVNSILFPQTLTCDGRLIVASTPPKTPSHPFREMCLEAMFTGDYVTKTIHEAEHVTPELIKAYAKETGGEHTTDWRREYLAEFVTDEALAVIPEFAENKLKIVQPHERPSHFDAYVSVDFGFNDLTFGVFGFWDFRAAKLVIEDELVLKRPASGQIAREVIRKEKLLWGDKRPRLRVADAAPELLADFAANHRLPFLKTARDDRESSINELRLLITNGQLVILPNCVNLIEHMANAIWKPNLKDFERSGEHGHFDGVAAMMYLVRNIARGANPFPKFMNGESQRTHFIPPGSGKDTKGVAGVFKKRRLHR